MPFFATGYIRLLHRFLVHDGVDEHALFAGTGCSAQDLVEPNLLMPFDAQMTLISNAQQLAAPGLALRVGEQLQVAAHGALGTAMQSAPNLAEALHTFATFIDARASFFHITLNTQKRQSSVAINLEGLPPNLAPFFSESLLHALNHGIRYFSGQPQGLLRIELAYADPGYGPAYTHTFACPVRFDAARTQVFFDSRWLSLASPEADPLQFQQSISRLQQQSGSQATEAALQHSVRNFLIDNPGQLWTLAQVAPHYAMSGRTLMRRLQAEGTNYQTLRDQVYQELAVEYLRTMSVEAAAVALGFADTASFRRTFKRWQGMAPGDWKARTSAT